MSIPPCRPACCRTVRDSLAATAQFMTQEYQRTDPWQHLALLQEAGNLSILFDVGGVLGGAVAGSLSDRCVGK